MSVSEVSTQEFPSGIRDRSVPDSLPTIDELTGKSPQTYRNCPQVKDNGTKTGDRAASSQHRKSQPNGGVSLLGSWRDFFYRFMEMFMFYSVGFIVSGPVCSNAAVNREAVFALPYFSVIGYVLTYFQSKTVLSLYGGIAASGVCYNLYVLFVAGFGIPFSFPLLRVILFCIFFYTLYVEWLSIYGVYLATLNWKKLSEEKRRAVFRSPLCCLLDRNTYHENKNDTRARGKKNKVWDFFLTYFGVVVIVFWWTVMVSCFVFSCCEWDTAVGVCVFVCVDVCVFLSVCAAFCPEDSPVLEKRFSHGKNGQDVSVGGDDTRGENNAASTEKDADVLHGTTLMLFCSSLLFNGFSNIGFFLSGCPCCPCQLVDVYGNLLSIVFFYILGYVLAFSWSETALTLHGCLIGMIGPFGTYAFLWLCLLVDVSDNFYSYCVFWFLLLFLLVQFYCFLRVMLSISQRKHFHRMTFGGIFL